MIHCGRCKCYYFHIRVDVLLLVKVLLHHKTEGLTEIKFRYPKPNNRSTHAMRGILVNVAWFVCYYCCLVGGVFYYYFIIIKKI